MKKSFLSLITIVTLGAAINSSSAAVISGSFVGFDFRPEYDNTLDPTESAGVVAASNWTNLAGQAGLAVGPNAGLVDDAGVATTATVAWNAAEAWSQEVGFTIQPTPNGTMFNGYIGAAETNPVALTISNIPYTSYDLYVYVDGDGNEGRRGSFSLNGGAAKWTSDTTNWDGTFIEGTGTDWDSATHGANYIHFTGLTGPVAVIEGNSQPWRAAINGFQVVNTAVPEPTSVALIGLGLGVLLIRRRCHH